MNGEQPNSSTGSCCFIYELQLSLLYYTSTPTHQLSLQWRTATERWPLLSLLLKSSPWFVTGTWMATCSVLELGFKVRASISYHTYYLPCRFWIKPSRAMFYNWTALPASIGVFGRTLRRKCVKINTILNFKFHPSLGFRVGACPNSLRCCRKHNLHALLKIQWTRCYFTAISNYYWTSPSIYLFIYLFLFFIFSRTTPPGFNRFQKLILHCITEIHKSFKSLVV